MSCPLGDRPTIKQATAALADSLLGLDLGENVHARSHPGGAAPPRGDRAAGRAEAHPDEHPGGALPPRVGRPRREEAAGADRGPERRVPGRARPPIWARPPSDPGWTDPRRPPRPRSPAPPDEARPEPIDLQDFARRVQEAARSSPSGWFGDGKVFIAHVWRALREDPAFRGMDDAGFKLRLIEAHRAGLLELGRADLVEAMDPDDVRESATPYLDAGLPLHPHRRGGPDDPDDAEPPTAASTMHASTARVRRLLLAGGPGGLPRRSPTATTSGRTDPFDVETIHEEARAVVPAAWSHRAAMTPGPDPGPDPAASGRVGQRQDAPDAGLPQLGPRRAAGLLRLHADDLGHRATTAATS